MDRFFCFSRSFLCWGGLFCVLSVAFNVDAATRKNVSMPTAQAVATSSASGVPVKSGSSLFIPGAAQGEYIPFEPGNRKIPLKVTPGADFSIPRTITAVKGILKTNLASIVLGGTIAGLLAGVDYLIEDSASGPILTKKGDNSGPISSDSSAYWCSSNATGSTCQDNRKFATALAVINADIAMKAPYESFASSVTCGTVTSCKAYSGSYWYAGRKGSCSSGWSASGGGCADNSSPSVPVTTADIDSSSIDNFVTTQNAEWLRSLIRESCKRSLTPATCFDAIKTSSALNGPSAVTGPSVSTSTVYTKPDGTSGLKTSTTTNNYKVAYGPTYFDFSKTQTTTVNEDGEKVFEETVLESDEVDSEQPVEDTTEDAPSPCVSDCDGPEYVDLYTPTEITKESELDTYSSRFAGIPLIAAVGGFFDVSASGASCPVWSYHGELNLYAVSMPLDLDFNYHCLPWFVSLGPWIQAIFALGFTYIAFRIAIL